VKRLLWLMTCFALAACGSGNSTTPRSAEIVVPEFIFQVDFGAPGAGEDFWFEWAEARTVEFSQRRVQSVFDQSELQLTLEACWLQQSLRCKSQSKIKFADRAAVNQTEIPLVLRDGAVFQSDGRLTIQDLPPGRYEIELLFHDALARNGSKGDKNSKDGDKNSKNVRAGVVAIELQIGQSLVDLGQVEVSAGQDASLPSSIQYEFNIVENKPIRLLFRCVRTGFILNGFRLSKFFGGPAGPEPDDLVLRADPSRFD